MKKILFVIPYVPYPLNSGGSQAFFHMTEYIRHKMAVSILLHPRTQIEEKHAADLAKIWNNVEFFIFKEKMEAPMVKHPSYYQLLNKIKKSVTRKMRRLLITQKDIFRDNSLATQSFFQPLNSQYIMYASKIFHHNFDIIQIEFYELLSLGYLLPPNVKTIFVHHEVRYIRNENEMALFNKVTDEECMLFRIAKDFECSALKKFQYIIALTEIDKEIITRLIGRGDHIYTSPAVVQIRKNNSYNFVPATTRFTFLGSECHFPNLDAIIWFCNEIAPSLRKKGMEFTFQVIGYWQSTYIHDLRNICPEIEFTGYIEDIESFLQGSIFLVPIRIGSGMRMKILDAILAGIPFITTSKGVEGINLHSGEECLTADTADKFAEEIIRLSKNPELQKRLAVQANIKLQKLYHPQTMLRQRIHIYEQILSSQP